MPIVSNTSPILNLSIIDKLDLLRRQFTEVLIPPAVQMELKVETQLPGAVVIRQAMEAQWLRVVDLKNSHLARALALELDQGEAAAIALALELGTEHILMDEHDGRARAKAMGIQPVGVLGVLLRAKREGHLSSVESVLWDLRREAGFFIADNLLEAALIEAGERR
jgi:predicted nucleic acid-binding protein